MAQKTSNIFETQQGSALGPPLGPPHLQMVTVKAVVAVYVICSAAERSAVGGQCECSSGLLL